MSARDIYQLVASIVDRTRMGGRGRSDQSCLPNTEPMVVGMTGDGMGAEAPEDSSPSLNPAVCNRPGSDFGLISRRGNEVELGQLARSLVDRTDDRVHQLRRKI